MSLILEALRKSESERQMGQLPGLMSPAAPSRAGRRQSSLLVGLAALLLLGLIGAGAWWMGRLSNGGASTTASSPLPPASERLASDTGPASVAPDALAAVPAASGVPPVTAVSVPPPAPPAPQQAPSTGMVVLSSTPTAASTDPTTVSVAPDKAPSNSPTPMAAVPTSATPPPIARPPHIDLMPAAERNGLPPLKLSVHVYHDQVERRFAIIDGRRMLQGQQFSDTISIESIERDGIWLDINGSTWWLPR